MSREEREEFKALDYASRAEKKAFPYKRKVDPASRCERCMMPRDNGRFIEYENAHPEVLCDYCDYELTKGERHTDGELSHERLVQLGYEIAP